MHLRDIETEAQAKDYLVETLDNIASKLRKDSSKIGKDWASAMYFVTRSSLVLRFGANVVEPYDNIARQMGVY